MKAKVKLPLNNNMMTSNAHWPHKHYSSKLIDMVYPDEWKYLWRRNISINVIRSLSPKLGTHKFISPRDGKIYWISREFFEWDIDAAFEIDF